VPLHARHVVRAYSDWERHKAQVLADAGYAVTLIDGDPAAKIAATDIRARLRDDPISWSDLVPVPVAAMLAELR
jgi:nicotinamide-nucleotide adenylyltransferase